MKPTRIMELLQEAVTADWKRRNAIAVEICHASAALNSEGFYEVGTPASGVKTLFGATYVQFCNEAPHMLPYLYPIAAAMAGDGDGRTWLVDVDLMPFKAFLFDAMHGAQAVRS